MSCSSEKVWRAGFNDGGVEEDDSGRFEIWFKYVDNVRQVSCPFICVYTTGSSLPCRV